jgi:ferredoxin-NADP reductase
MGIVSPGFRGRPRSGREKLPPGQYLVTDFPVLSAGPTPRVNTGSWEFRITTETATGRTIVLDVPGWPGHAAGQHVDVRLTAEDGYSAQRSYSIASAPARDRLELTVQRLEDGEVSSYLTDVLMPGYPLELRGPTGFVEAAASLLVKAGHDASVIKTERFGPSGGQA